VSAAGAIACVATPTQAGPCPGRAVAVVPSSRETTPRPTTLHRHTRVSACSSFERTRPILRPRCRPSCCARWPSWLLAVLAVTWSNDRAPPDAGSSTSSQCGIMMLRALRASGVDALLVRVAILPSLRQSIANESAPAWVRNGHVDRWAATDGRVEQQTRRIAPDHENLCTSRSHNRRSGIYSLSILTLHACS
jgi:hypothetical protein